MSLRPQLPNSDARHTHTREQDHATRVGMIGGAGHSGLPLALLLADSGIATSIYDIDRHAVAKIASGTMPFAESEGQETLTRVLEKGSLTFVEDINELTQCGFLIITIGTPVDDHLSPRFGLVRDVLESLSSVLRSGQTIILRSTVFPGTTDSIQRFLEDRGLEIGVAFCPERIAQGRGLVELRELPQIISSFDSDVLNRVRELLSFVPEFIAMEPLEAELAKLMTNSWRYIQFAIVNQFYMIATAHDVDFERILHGCRHNYPRMAAMTSPGFTAGPCLLKDTMQLAAFSQNHFPLGHAAMLVNEGLPSHLVEMVKKQMDLRGATAAVLGMAFKPESDDRRDSLSYRLKDLLMLECKEVLCTDPYVDDGGLVPLETVVERADVVFVATPHAAYDGVTFPDDTLVVDAWAAREPGGFIPTKA